MDGYAVTRSAQSTDWGAICYELLRAIPDNINGGPIGQLCHRGDALSYGMLECMPDSSPFPINLSQSLIYRPLLHEGSHEGGSSSQHLQLDPLLEKPQSPPEQPQYLPEAETMRNPTRNRR
ncbi:hypothetical protein J1N35_034022 [Gossypium stocksii]|uniref:Uncharacterized protein n=1 Tax=Gossypium stocksii TaxID=47602 RepID=A0A9D3ZQ16_9ROSI|nr:hypothetical protein J1N35_034022 [Gossypium stocksii]